MFNQSMSELDHLNSFDGSQESEVTNNYIDESQIVQLREQIDQLMRENTSLRAQFEDALSIANNIENVHLDNKQLRSAVHEYQIKIDNLHQRLELSSKTIDELNRKIISDNEIALATREHDRDSMQKEIQKIKEQSKAQLDNLYEKLDQVNKIRDQCDLEQKLLNGKVERCIENAQHFFQNKFSHFDDLVSFLGTTPCVDSQISCIQPSQSLSISTLPRDLNTANDKIQKLTKRLKHEHKKLKDQLKVQDNLEATINKMKRDQNDLVKRHQNEINQLKKEFEQKEEDMNLRESDYRHQIQQLSAKVDVLEKRLQNRNKEKGK